MKTLQKGFSLIELMIVIAIIGILAAIAIPSYQSYVYKAKLGELMSAASAGELAAAEYVNSSGSADCGNMPIVSQNNGVQSWAVSSDYTGNSGAFPYPSSNLVSSVSIDSACNVIVIGQPGQWGADEATYGQPLIFMSPFLSDQGFDWHCYVGNEAGSSTLSPIKPNNCVGIDLAGH